MRRFTNSAGNNLGQLSRRARQLQKDFSGFSAASKLIAAAGGTLAARQLLTGMNELEKAMLAVESNLVGGAKSAADLQAQLAAVRDTARQISGMTIFSDAEMVVLTNQLLKSGVKAEFVNGKDGAALSTAALAQLGGLSPEQSAGYMGALGNAFSFDKKEQYMGLGNHIVKADDASAMNSGNIMYNMQQTAASAAALKIDPKRIVSLIAYLDALGNEAGTSVNRLLGNLSPGTKQKRKAMAKSGMDFWQENKDGTVVLKDIGTVLEIIRKKFSSMKSTPEKMELSKKLFGEEGERAVLLLSSKKQTFDQFEQSVISSTGAIDKLNIQNKGLSSAFERLKNTTFSKLDTQFAPERDVMTRGVDSATKLVDNGKLPDMAKGVTAAAGLALLSRFNSNRKTRLAGEAQSLAGAARSAAVQSVLVTNWPAGMLSVGERMGGGPSNRAGAGGAPVGNTGNEPPARSSGMGKAATALGAAGAAFSGWEIGQAIGGVAKELIDSTIQAVTGQESATLGTAIYDMLHKSKIDTGGELHIKIDSPTPVKVASMKSNDPRQTINVDAGPTMAGTR